MELVISYHQKQNKSSSSTDSYFSNGTVENQILNSLATDNNSLYADKYPTFCKKLYYEGSVR